MARMPFCTLMMIIALLVAPTVAGQDGLNPTGEPRYGSRALAPGVLTSPFTLDVVSGGDVAVKPLALADNCLGYAASDPDVLVELAAGFDRITFLVASAEDTTLIANLPNGSWSCNDDTNGLNPALVYHKATPGRYQIWIGSYAPDTFDEAVLYITEAGPEALPTTATGPDPARDATYGETTLAPYFQPAPFAVQFLGGGRSQASDFIDDPKCRGFVAEAPDYSIILSEVFPDLYFAAHSPADVTLIINGADGGWYCSDKDVGKDPVVHFSYAAAGLYDIWVGSAQEGNYTGSILYVMETEPDPPPDFSIDTSCPGLPDTGLYVGEQAIISNSGAAIYSVPESASTVIFRPAKGTALSLIAGPACIGDQRWWRVELGDGNRGWIAEGDGESVWLASVP
ncbi:MAG: hypothetical protein OXG78_04775 [Chloroflexi bacterium]|nr:hypothetical protein [Chloroflexota bacterium]